MTKDTVLFLLREREGRFLSGEELAAKLSLSRTAVWKAVAQLKREGYPIEALPRRGYRLAAGGDVLSAENVYRRLRHRELTVEVYPSLPSTNTALKARAAEGAPEGLVLSAEEQTAGRGRMGRSFYSPAGSGLYMSLLLRPRCTAREATALTACAAVAVAETIEALSGQPARIKWVNDVLMGDRKVCGILTEASLDCESGTLSYAVIGIGVNIAIPEEGFPEELRGIAGAAFTGCSLAELRAKLAAGILDRLMDYADDPGNTHCYDAYRARSMALGRTVKLLRPGQAPERAEVLGLERDYALLVRGADGAVRRISSGEISLRLSEG